MFICRKRKKGRSVGMTKGTLNVRMVSGVLSWFPGGKGETVQAGKTEKHRWRDVQDVRAIKDRDDRHHKWDGKMQEEF